jgi:hypothetical protein
LGTANPVAIAAIKIDPADQVILDKFLEHTHQDLDTLTKEHFQQVKVPEMICWLDCPRLGMALTAFELTGDADYLHRFVAAVENLRSTLKKGEDGFLGWYGSPLESLADPAKPNAVTCEIQTDFRVTMVLSRFVALIDADPKLKKEFAAQRAAYVDLMKNHLVKKWDPSFEDLGPRGAIYHWNKDYKPIKAHLTLPHEKVSMMIQGLLGLYRVTGNDEYMRNAVKLGINFKHCLELNNGAYAWRCWDPMGAWDVSPDDPLKWKSWIAAEPIAQWYSSSLTSIVLLYHYGVVFDRTDLDRFLKTQMSVCWNGDLANPLYFATDGSPAKPKERFTCPALAPFDANLAKLLYTGPAQAERVAKSADEWQGGVTAADWLYGKYILDPAVKDGKPLYGAVGEKFLKNKENAQWMKSLAFEVTPPGYHTPLVPPVASGAVKPGN